MKKLAYFNCNKQDKEYQRLLSKRKSMGSDSSNQRHEIEQLKKELLFYRSYDSFIKQNSDLF